MSSSSTRSKHVGPGGVEAQTYYSPFLKQLGVKNDYTDNIVTVLIYFFEWQRLGGCMH